MAWADKLKPYYLIKVVCDNCGKKCEIRIKKGTTISEAVKERQLKCDFCGVTITPKEYSTPWLK